MENNKQTILILDGTIDNMDALAKALENKNRVVLKTTDALEGAKLFASEKVDLIVTDPHHYDSDQSEIFDALRKGNLTDIPLLFAVNNDAEETKISSELTGHMIDFVKRPADPAVVSARANHLLEIKQLREEVSALREELGKYKSTSEQSEKKLSEMEGSIKKKDELVNASAQELQSFVYTVSHDLRAPLRAINGFTQILEEEFSKNLSEEALRLFGMIKQNATKMGRLIDDLLTFSRLSRKQIVAETMNMNDVVFAAINEIGKAQPHKAKITAKDLPAAKGDFSLIKQAIMNLLSNAIKFSSRKENAEIEIGALKAENENVYYVKDNGVGFSMDYADKLFGVFQRLHSEGEFEGTGIGLAIVKRIISMHGGRVWAEGKTDEGATFYFSLPL